MKNYNFYTLIGDCKLWIIVLFSIFQPILPAQSYVQIIRLHHAQHLLQTTEQNVAQIAYSVGFKNATYLAEFGHSPSEEG